MTSFTFLLMLSLCLSTVLLGYVHKPGDLFCGGSLLLQVRHHELLWAEPLSFWVSKQFVKNVPLFHLFHIEGPILLLLPIIVQHISSLILAVTTYIMVPYSLTRKEHFAMVLS